MKPELLIWIMGNLLMPAIPVACVYLAQRIAGQEPGVASVLKDGVLSFYALTIASVLIMDVWKDRIGASPVLDALSASAIMVVAVLVLIFLSGIYFVMSLAHTGRLDQEGRPFDISHLANLSWQCALGMAILSLLARLWSGLY